jgi:hypothetical protein
MCDHRHDKIPSTGQVQPTEQESVPNILNHASAALGDMRTAKHNADQDQACSPTHSHIAKQASHSIHQVSPINQLFAEGSEHPYQCQVNQQRFRFPTRPAKSDKSGIFPIQRASNGCVTKSSSTSIARPTAIPTPNALAQLLGGANPTSLHFVPRSRSEIHPSRNKYGVLLKKM